jgi:hypothetical protein
MAATYSAAERRAKKIGSLGSVASLISAIGGGRPLEAGGRKPSTATGDEKSKKWKKGNKKKGKQNRGRRGASMEMQEMLQGRYRGKTTTAKTRPTMRSGPI